MKTLKIFLKLKYQETIGACLDWLFNWKNIKEGLVLIGVFIGMVTVFVGTMCGLGSLIWWFIPNNYQAYDFDEVMSIGILSTVWIGIIVIITIAFLRWIKSNWKKATELAKK